MCNQQDGFAFQFILDASVKNVTSNFGINRTQRVVQEVDILVSIHCSSKVNSLLLSSTLNHKHKITLKNGAQIYNMHLPTSKAILHL
jgi:hypothetical protein